MSADTDPEKKAQQLKEVLDELPQDVLEALRVELLEEAAKENGNFALMIARRFTGPVPPPEILKDYDGVQPGFAERIMSMAERELAHRHEMEKKGLFAAITAERLGQMFAFILSLMLIGGSIYLIAKGNTISGTLLGGSTLIGLAYVFITGRKPHSKDEAESEDNAVRKDKHMASRDD